MNLHKLGDVELGLLENFSLANEHILERVDGVARLFDLLCVFFCQGLFGMINKCVCVSVSELHDRDHNTRKTHVPFR